MFCCYWCSLLECFLFFPEGNQATWPFCFLAICPLALGPGTASLIKLVAPLCFMRIWANHVWISQTYGGYHIHSQETKVVSYLLTRWTSQTWFYVFIASPCFLDTPLCRALVHPTEVLCQKNPICLRRGQKGYGEDKTGIEVRAEVIAMSCPDTCNVWYTLGRA